MLEALDQQVEARVRSERGGDPIVAGNPLVRGKRRLVAHPQDVADASENAVAGSTAGRAAHAVAFRAAHHCRNDCAGIAGRSRVRVQAASGPGAEVT